MSPSDRQPTPEDRHSIEIHLDHLLQDREMTLTELAEQAGISIVNLSILKNRSLPSVKRRKNKSAVPAKAAAPARKCVWIHRKMETKGE